MMVRTVRLLVLLIVISNALCGAIGAEGYWIAFNSAKSKDGPPPSGGPKHLMKIDVFGNTIVGPKKVIQNSATYLSPGTAGIAISSHNQNALNLWIPDARNNFGNISRAVINKNTLRLISLQKTSLKSSNIQYIQVTQRPQKNFLALLINEANYIGFGISPIGIPSSFTWMLSRNPTDCLGCPYALSSDGKFVLISDLISSTNPNKQKLLVQRLGPMGRPIADPVPLPSGRLASALDISGPLSNGCRYVLYSQDIKQPNRPIFLQIIDSEGNEIGERNQIGSDVAHFQSAAIDPKGRFIVYITRKYGGSDVVYQALDGIGRRSGDSRVLASNVSVGVDLLIDS